MQVTTPVELDRGPLVSFGGWKVASVRFEAWRIGHKVIGGDEERMEERMEERWKSDDAAVGTLEIAIWQDIIMS